MAELSGASSNAMTTSHQLLLTLFPGLYAVARYEPHEKPAIDYSQSSFCSFTKTDKELSVVCEQSALPEGVHAESNRRLLRVESVLAFTLTGVLAALAEPLAAAAISLFAISTYDTDYLLIADADLERAIAILESAGHKVQRSPLQ